MYAAAVLLAWLTVCPRGSGMYSFVVRLVYVQSCRIVNSGWSKVKLDTDINCAIKESRGDSQEGRLKRIKAGGKLLEKKKFKSLTSNRSSGPSYAGESLWKND
ncbi:hypothetical protein EV424DRAFT_1387645 [Suillus variegatus]|nr:hypothetical protein EV424DRAFT_1387645 [Suillus variegatus]